MPVLYFRLKKKSGARIFKLPTGITQKKATYLCVKWILDGARRRNSHSTYDSFSKKLAAEFLDISKGYGYSVRKKKKELYKIILDSRPFLRYRS